MIRVVCELTIRSRTTSGSTVLKVVDQLEGPQQTLPVLTAFQTADTPERFEQFVARLRTTSATWPRTASSCARGSGAA